MKGEFWEFSASALIIAEASYCGARSKVTPITGRRWSFSPSVGFKGRNIVLVYFLQIMYILITFCCCVCVSVCGVCGRVCTCMCVRLCVGWGRQHQAQIRTER